jgi:hypothetical protein
VKFPTSSNWALMKWLCGIQASKNGEPGNNCAYSWAASLWEVVTEGCAAMLERVLNYSAAFIY